MHWRYCTLNKFNWEMEGSGKRKAEIIDGLGSKRKSTRTRTIKRNRKWEGSIWNNHQKPGEDYWLIIHVWFFKSNSNSLRVLKTLSVFNIKTIFIIILRNVFLSYSHISVQIHWYGFRFYLITTFRKLALVEFWCFSTTYLCKSRFSPHISSQTTFQQIEFRSK